MPLDLRYQLEARFREQQQFAAGYSPLYAQLFDTVAGWLAGDRADPLVDWLLAAAAGRAPLDVTLLLPAALHRDVLAGEPAVAAIAPYFTTAERAPHEEVRVSSRLPADDLRAALLARRHAYAEFIGRATVQTNETARGVAWLLPLACLGWPAVHLIELGASAGLNLVAERRGYRLIDAAMPERVLALGEGLPQFTMRSQGGALPSVACCPQILSRTGGDIHPFHLRDAADELTLAAYVWGDQPERMARLREGIAALRTVERSAAPVRLWRLRLPDELPGFLERSTPPSPIAPVVLFNTIVTMYLPDRGASLRGMVDEWARRQDVPVLWLQWEPAWQGPPPPVRDWSAWTANYWPNDGSVAHHVWQLGWVHPHGTAVAWGAGWGQFLSNVMQN